MPSANLALDPGVVFGRAGESVLPMPWRVAVSGWERMAQKVSPPCMERTQPGTLTRSLLILMTCSASLLLNGTLRSWGNRR
jgi:hypothetical protein